MFGKKSKMSANDRFLMQAGRANGNLVTGKKGETFAGSKGGMGGAKGKEGPNPFRTRDVSPGKAGPVKITG